MKLTQTTGPNLEGRNENEKEEKAEPKEEKKPEDAQSSSDAYLRLLAEYDRVVG